MRPEATLPSGADAGLPGGGALGVARSILGRRWRWRGGNMALGDGSEGAATLDHDIVTQLLLARGVAPGDLERQRSPTLRAFRPDPSVFADMDVAANRVKPAVSL